MLLASFCLILATGTVVANQKAVSVSVRVKTDQPGADVSLDGKPVGQTPLTLSPLSDGKYTLTFVKPGYEDHVEVLEVRSGKPSSVFVVLKAHPVPLPPLPVHYATRHLHETDSCEGDLAVYADRLEYVARSSGPHNMAIPISQIKMTMRRHSATYLHNMQTLPLAGTVAVGGGQAGPVAPVYIESSGGDSSFLVIAEGTKETDTVATRTLYELVYRLWDGARKKTQPSQ